MLVLVLPPVSSRMSGFPVASPCLWGKLQNLSFCHVANWENCRKSRRKCWFFCMHVSCLESFVFLWRRRVYGGSWKTSPFRRFPRRLSCCFAWHAWLAAFPVASPCLWGKLENMSFSNVSKQVAMSFCVAGVALCDIPTCLITCGKYQNWRKSRTKCSFFFAPTCLVSSLWFSCGVAVSVGGSCKKSPLPRFRISNVLDCWFSEACGL